MAAQTAHQILTDLVTCGSRGIAIRSLGINRKDTVVFYVYDYGTGQVKGMMECDSRGKDMKLYDNNARLLLSATQLVGPQKKTVFTVSINTNCGSRAIASLQDDCIFVGSSTPPSKKIEFKTAYPRRGLTELTFSEPTIKIFIRQSFLNVNMTCEAESSVEPFLQVLMLFFAMQLWDKHTKLATRWHMPHILSEKKVGVMPSALDTLTTTRLLNIMVTVMTHENYGDKYVYFYADRSRDLLLVCRLMNNSRCNTLMFFSNTVGEEMFYCDGEKKNKISQLTIKLSGTHKSLGSVQTAGPFKTLTGTTDDGSEFRVVAPAGRTYRILSSQNKELAVLVQTYNRWKIHFLSDNVDASHSERTVILLMCYTLVRDFHHVLDEPLPLIKKHLYSTKV